MNNILALGADMKSCFAYLSKEDLHLGQPCDDLSNVDNLKALETDLRSYVKDKGNIDYIVCDMHPGYHSTRLAKSLHKENKGSRVLEVQHHFAHIASCMQDNNIDSVSLGISFDGTGYGVDGNLWGGEFLLCDKKRFYRLFHLKYIPQPGGDIASRQGWRMALSYLVSAYGGNVPDVDIPVLRDIEKNKISFVCQMIRRGINSPLTSSAGRLFDAVASILGIAHLSNFEAEAAISLEKAAAKDVGEFYSYDIIAKEIDLSPMIVGIVEDIKDGVSAPVISAKFHNTLGELIFDISQRVHMVLGLNDVLISGGCFQNRYLTEYITNKFEGSGINLLRQNRYSQTDLGICVGQVAVALNQ